ncbi:MAG TPA: pyridoxamine 5'-phosphate oxidase family protein [Candidatus Paceibacterota bacterium]|nr:pyridoxamine 5'-phosphate oxidase family protein [Candidatus Paceibacterota bacterium]
MPEEALQFIATQRVGVLAVRMPDGSPHAATIHFAYVPTLGKYIFRTSPESRKVESVKQGETTGSFVIGSSEAEMKTLQMDGVVKLEDSEEIQEAYLGGLTDKSKESPDVYLTFTPTWWRYTDWTLPQGKTIFSSDAK